LDAVEGARALRRIFEAYPEVRAKCPHLKFKGRGQRDTPVADIATIVEIIFLLPGRTLKNTEYLFLAGSWTAYHERKRNGDAREELKF